MKTIAEQLSIKEFPFEIKDKDGNQIYSEDSDGFWGRSEYDSKGNEVYSENSNGYWEKREFDTQGKQTYFEDSDGEVIDNRVVPEYTMEELVEKIGNFKIKK